MASDNMKMKIVIDGDNSGFKKSLNQTSRDIKQFEQKQGGGGVGGGGLAALAGGAGLSEVMRRGALRNSASVLGLPGKQTPGRTGIQAFLGTMLGNPKMKEHISKARGAVASAAASKGSGLTTEGHLASQRAGRAGQGTLTGAAAGGFIKGALMSAAASAAIAAAAVVAFNKLASSGVKQLSDSTRFSAATSVAQAQKEQRDIMRQLDMANNPMIQAQQQRLILAQENAANQDASGLGYVATEMAIDFNNFWAWVKSFASSSIGADAITNNGVVY